jgi:hypothetical protein
MSMSAVAAAATNSLLDAVDFPLVVTRNPAMKPKASKPCGLALSLCSKEASYSKATYTPGLCEG